MYNVLGRILAVMLFHTRNFHLFPPLLLDIATHSKQHEITRSQFKVALSNNTTLLVDLLQSVQNSPNLLSGKETTMQTLRLTHGLDLRLIGVLGGDIAE